MRYLLAVNQISFLRKMACYLISLKKETIIDELITNSQFDYVVTKINCTSLE